jgi:hypothetical protein
VTDYSIFTTAAPSFLGSDADHNPVTVGTAFHVGAAWACKGVRVFLPTDSVANSTITVYLYEQAPGQPGNLLAVKTGSALNNQWNTVLFDTQVDLAPTPTGPVYYVAAYLAHGGFIFQPSSFASAVASAATANLVAAASSESSPGNGFFHYGTFATPESPGTWVADTFNSAFYGVDPIVTDDVATPPPPPGPRAARLHVLTNGEWVDVLDAD